MAATSDIGEFDEFDEFVSALERSMTTPSSTDDLAEAMHLSRSQLGRIVVALLGESPAQFRRRIMLERAASRLITSGESIVRIAIEAGFTSHEGFIRAFERAYGMAPSAWRIAPGAVALTTPNGVHFQHPEGLRIPGEEKVTTMDVLMGMLEHHVWLCGELIGRARGLDDAVLDEPVASADFVDDAPTIRSLLSRLAGQLQMWNEVTAGRSYDFGIEDHEPIAAIADRWAVHAPRFLQLARDVVVEGRLDDTFVFVEKSGPKLYTYGGLFAHILSFGGHRRIEVLGALAEHGIDDLGFGDPREWIPEHLAG